LGAASPLELIGRSRLEFLRPEHVDGATRRWELVKEGQDLPVWEVETVRLDRVSFPSLIRTEQMNIDGYIYAIVVLEDVSLVRRAAQAIKDSEEKYRSLIEFFPQGVLLTEKGNITQINPAGLRLYGAETEADILGRDWISLVEESHRDRMSQRRQMMSEGNRVESTELELLRLDGTSFWVRA
jgi:PAS domain S-box-containing protein